MSLWEFDGEWVLDCGQRNTHTHTPGYCSGLLLLFFQGCTFKVFKAWLELIAAHSFTYYPWSTQSVSQLVRAITAAAKLHCLRDNAWLTWSTSEPDILLSLHHNTTSQTDMAGPLISRAGLTDLLCAHCNGCMVSSDVARLQRLDQNTNTKMELICGIIHCSSGLGLNSLSN